MAGSYVWSVLNRYSGAAGRSLQRKRFVDRAVCATCAGSGVEPKYEARCPACGGEGSVDFHSTVVTCLFCRGSGCDIGDLSCLGCKGLGIVPVSDDATVCSSCGGTGQEGLFYCSSCKGQGLR